MDKIKRFKNHKEGQVDRKIYMSNLSAMTGEDLYGKAEICEEITIRDMRIEKLEQETADLHELCTKRKDSNVRRQKEIYKLKAENATLKQLVSDLWEAVGEAGYEDHCIGMSERVDSAGA